MAPYAVRRTPYALESELEKVYKESGEDILKGIAERVNATSTRVRGRAIELDDEERAGGNLAREQHWAPVRIRDVIRQWMAPLMGR